MLLLQLVPTIGLNWRPSLSSLLESTQSSGNSGRCLNVDHVNSVSGTAASSAGVMSLKTCAEYMRDQTVRGETISLYVSWNSELSECESYSYCACASGGVCSTDSGWESGSISALLPHTKSVLSVSSNIPDNEDIGTVDKPIDKLIDKDPLATEGHMECNGSSSEYERMFQYKCLMETFEWQEVQVVSVFVAFALFITVFLFSIAWLLNVAENRRFSPLNIE